MGFATDYFFADLDKGTTEKVIKSVYFELKDDLELILIELYKGLMPLTVKELGSWAKICILKQVLEEVDCETYEVSKQNLIKALKY